MYQGSHSLKPDKVIFTKSRYSFNSISKERPTLDMDLIEI